ncbi:hypothetical protein A4X09_0g7657 [Tilletia walkeri]|uniref:Uncharacterized protein n=1 Tax=Tilletia walkeri TaxID=117179 RepID=A0A8X7N1H3_9BASI|nr:hypothetical protein A4X09_0g7657 [Tilletia walkeri]
MEYPPVRLPSTTPAPASAVSLPGARHGQHSFDFRVGGAPTGALVNELNSRAARSDHQIKVLDRKRSAQADDLRAEQAAHRPEQAAHLQTKQKLALVELTAELDANTARQALVVEQEAGHEGPARPLPHLCQSRLGPAPSPRSRRALGTSLLLLAFRLVT